jgi:hypothetical protein
VTRQRGERKRVRGDDARVNATIPSTLAFFRKNLK